MSHPILRCARLRTRELIISPPDPEPVLVLVEPDDDPEPASVPHEPDTPGADPRFYIGLDIAARIIGLFRSKADNVRSLEHWARKGWTLPPENVPVRLQTVRIGGKFMTTRAWCLDFAAARYAAYRRRDERDRESAA